MKKPFNKGNIPTKKKPVFGSSSHLQNLSWIDSDTPWHRYTKSVATIRFWLESGRDVPLYFHGKGFTESIGEHLMWLFKCSHFGELSKREELYKNVNPVSDDSYFRYKFLVIKRLQEEGREPHDPSGSVPSKF